MIIVQNQPQEQFIKRNIYDREKIIIGAGLKRVSIGDLTSLESVYINTPVFDVSCYNQQSTKPHKIGLGMVSHSRFDNRVIIGGESVIIQARFAEMVEEMNQPTPPTQDQETATA